MNETEVKGKALKSKSSSSHVLICFFGTHNYAWVPRKCIKDYDKYYDEFSAKYNSSDFRKALLEVGKWKKRPRNVAIPKSTPKRAAKQQQDTFVIDDHDSIEDSDDTDDDDYCETNTKLQSFIPKKATITRRTRNVKSAPEVSSQNNKENCENNSGDIKSQITGDSYNIQNKNEGYNSTISKKTKKTNTSKEDKIKLKNKVLKDSPVIKTRAEAKKKVQNAKNLRRIIDDTNNGEENLHLDPQNQGIQNKATNQVINTSPPLPLGTLTNNNNTNPSNSTIVINNTDKNDKESNPCKELTVRLPNMLLFEMSHRSDNQKNEEQRTQTPPINVITFASNNTLSEAPVSALRPSLSTSEDKHLSSNADSHTDSHLQAIPTTTNLPTTTKRITLAQLLAGEVDESEIDGPRPLVHSANNQNDEFLHVNEGNRVEDFKKNNTSQSSSLKKSSKVERDDDDILTEVYNPSPSKSPHSSQESTGMITPTQPYHEDDESEEVNDDIITSRLPHPRSNEDSLLENKSNIHPQNNEQVSTVATATDRTGQDEQTPHKSFKPTDSLEKRVKSRNDQKPPTHQSKTQLSQENSNNCRQALANTASAHTNLGNENEYSPHGKKRPRFEAAKVHPLTQSDTEFELLKNDTKTMSKKSQTKKRQKIVHVTQSEGFGTDTVSISPQVSENALRKVITDELDKFRLEIQQLLRQQKSEIETILRGQKTTVEQLLVAYKDNIKEQIQQVKASNETLSVRVDTLARNLDKDIKSKLREHLLHHYETLWTELRKETSPPTTI